MRPAPTIDLHPFLTATALVRTRSIPHAMGPDCPLFSPVSSRQSGSVETSRHRRPFCPPSCPHMVCPRARPSTLLPVACCPPSRSCGRRSARRSAHSSSCRYDRPPDRPPARPPASGVISHERALDRFTVRAILVFDRNEINCVSRFIGTPCTGGPVAPPTGLLRES